MDSMEQHSAQVGVAIAHAIECYVSKQELASLGLCAG